MVPQDSLLVILVQLVDRLPMPPQPSKRGRGHPVVYTDRLFLKALVIMIVRHLHKVNELLSVLAQPTVEMAMLRAFFITARFASKEREAAIKATISSAILMSGTATIPSLLASGWPGS